MAKRPAVVDVRDEILKRMSDKGQNLTWLSKETGISYNTIFSCLRKKLFKLSQDNLDKINSTLETEFTLPE